MRRVPVYSLYSDTREPTAEMLAGLDAMVIDLQDIGARIYTYIYTMANCLRACARHGVRGDRLRSAEPDWRRGRRGPDARGRLRVVRRPVPDPDAPRHDHRRAGALLQRGVRHRRAPRGGADDRLVASHVRGRSRRTLGDAVAQHPDARQRHRLPGHGAVRGDHGVRGPRHDAAVRAGGRSVGAGGTDGRHAQPARPARRALPPRRVRADVPEARPRRVRRLPDSRAGSPPLPAGAGRRGLDRGDSRRGSLAVLVAAAALRIRARQDAHRHPVRLAVAPRRPSTAAPPPSRLRRRGPPPTRHS